VGFLTEAPRIGGPLTSRYNGRDQLCCGPEPRIKLTIPETSFNFRPVDQAHIALGLVIVTATVACLLFRYIRAAKQRRFAARGWVGLTILVVAEGLLFAGHRWVAIYFTPLAWTAYLLLIDAAVFGLRGNSRLSGGPREFLKLAFWSVPLWLVFEAYNLRLQNWTYVGLPASPLLQGIGYVWSFATIWPAILETADFLQALRLFRDTPARPWVLGTSARVSLFMVGIVLVIVPILVPRSLGQYLFGSVWVGFILLLDPLNYFARSPSVLGELERGRRATLGSLLAAGLVCGILWEFWNYWAAAKWHYTFPIMQGWKIFEMPLLGYLGFPPFGVECFVMYEFLGTLRRQLRVLHGASEFSSPQIAKQPGAQR